MGYRFDFVHLDTIKDVVKHYPRRNWSKCFFIKIREEVKVKPWCHITVVLSLLTGWLAVCRQIPLPCERISYLVDA